MNNKRPKRSRYRGTHTHQRGAKKKARGKGHRGGVGMSGTGKRADQKKTLVTKKYGHKYFGVDKRLSGKKKIESLDLRVVVDNLKKYGKKEGGAWVLDLKDKKILCTGDLKIKLKVTAKAASKGAVEKVKAAGGSVTLESEV